jgi:pimeloyl-ACP methyl ester carboxylesterase
LLDSWESFRDKITAPSGLSVYPRDITRPSRREAELRFTDLRWFEELPRGGHFAALEQPESLVEQVRGFFRLVRPIPREARARGMVLSDLRS